MIFSEKQTKKTLAGLLAATALSTSLQATAQTVETAVNLKPSKIQRSAVATAPMASRACQDWLHFMLDRGEEEGGLKTDQLVVMQPDRKILFSYAALPYRRNTRHTMWSVSKLITATIAGTAIQEGKLKLTDRLAQFYPFSLRRNKSHRAAYEQVTVQNLIAMTSGFKWSEHANDDVHDASDLAMLYTEGYHNLTRYMLDLDFAATPGSKWNYSSVNGNLVMSILKKIYGKDYDEMPWKNLFTPLGMKSAYFEQDAAGVFVGGAYANVSAEDLAKFGTLFLNDGMVDGKRILPEGWVKLAQTPDPTTLKLVKKRSDFLDYGPFSKAGFWLNLPVEGVGKSHPNAPASMMVSSGYLGQFLVVLPEQGLVIARTGHERNSDRNIDRMATGAIACFKK